MSEIVERLRKALEDAYKAGFEASAQGYNAEFFTEFESDNEWIAERDSAVDRIRDALDAVKER